MTRIEIIGGELYFDKTKIENLSSVQQGDLQDYVEQLPSVEELDDLLDSQSLSEEIEDFITKERKLNEDTDDDFTKDLIDELLDRLDDIVNGY